MAYDRNDRRYGRDQSYGYRPQGPARDYERGYDRGEDLSYNRDRGYGAGGYSRDRVDYGRPPQDYDRDDRGFFDRAGDEVRSWFGDEEAERRRRYDEWYDERQHARDRAGDRSRGGQGYDRDRAESAGAAAAAGLGMPYAGYGWNFRDDRQAGQREQARPDRDPGRDPSYHSWRDRQIEALDRDYDDYRREHQSKFDSEFTGWRSRRQGQRDSLGQVKEHQEVVGSDGQHVGKVDHVRGDRILLAKNDQNAGGHHHSIPVSWIVKVGDKVEIDRTAAEAQKAWKDEENDREGGGGPRGLNRSFSGTY